MIELERMINCCWGKVKAPVAENCDGGGRGQYCSWATVRGGRYSWQPGSEHMYILFSLTSEPLSLSRLKSLMRNIGLP